MASQYSTQELQKAVALYYDGKKWTKKKSNTDYLLLGIWGNKKDDVYVVGINPK